MRDICKGSFKPLVKMMNFTVEIDGKLLKLQKYGSSGSGSLTRRVKRTEDSLDLPDRHPTRHTLE